ncbi:ester cyclase [Streptomyces sp. NPDC054834]
MNDTTVQRNIATARLLLEDAMPNGRFDVIRPLVTRKELSAALSDQTFRTRDIAGYGNTVVLQSHMTALHSGTFAGAPATGKRLEWDEIGVLHFDDEGKITDLWFMCQEQSLGEQIGYRMQLS